MFWQERIFSERDEELLGVQRNAAGPPSPLPFPRCAGPLCTAHLQPAMRAAAAGEGRNLPLLGKTPSALAGKCPSGQHEVSLKKTKKKMEHARDLNLTEWLIKIMELLLSVWLQPNFKWLG